VCGILVVLDDSRLARKDNKEHIVLFFVMWSIAKKISVSMRLRGKGV
jgi:hypothetical protein